YSYLEQQRGRTEYRKYEVLQAAPFHLTEKWSKLTTIGKAIYYRIENGKELIDTRYYISSAQLSAEELANHVRSHWAVENQLHWVLDVSFREDNCPINRGHAAENFSTFRHVGLNQLKRESTLKASVRRKQRRAAMDTEYLDKVIRA
ncbi:ISAs1 family transposase, partial [Pseudoalteromonas aurantia]